MAPRLGAGRYRPSLIPLAHDPGANLETSDQSLRTMRMAPYAMGTPPQGDPSVGRSPLYKPYACSFLSQAPTNSMPFTTVGAA